MDSEKADVSETADGVADAEETAISMVDILEEEARLEDDANAVLGGSDPRNCTYLMGYVDRQAVYSCSTCISGDMESSMICLACSYECHEGHDLHELYTKRNFCCDCGNDKFKEKCKLCPTKRPRNEENQYNQNFHGLYCVCHRPYPDPEDEVEDDMIQCIVCEDWYHGRHLDCLVPKDYEEMTCGGCLKEKCGFLRAYSKYTTGTEMVKLTKDEDETEVSVCDTSTDGGNTVTEREATDSNTVLHQPDKQDEVSSCCEYQHLLSATSKQEQSGAMFWAEGWRQKLCKCHQCMQMYSDEKVPFLTDPADSVSAYEERGKAKSDHTSQYDKGMQQLSKMDRTQQVEMLQGYHDMKTELREYLKKFAENKKVVREEDIREFFSTMAARKKPRYNAPPPSCR